MYSCRRTVYHYGAQGSRTDPSRSPQENRKNCEYVENIAWCMSIGAANRIRALDPLCTKYRVITSGVTPKYPEVCRRIVGWYDLFGCGVEIPNEGRERAIRVRDVVAKHIENERYVGSDLVKAIS